GELLGRYPRQLPGGQRQRVALGRAIVRRPKAFLLDEPLSNVDAKLRAQMRLELRALQQDLRATFIYVTHDQLEAMTMGDRIAVMKDGVLQQVGPPRHVYDHPANLFVAGFIGTPAMSFIPVAVAGRIATGSALEIELPWAPGVDEGVLGIRAEALHENAAPGEPTLELDVDTVEILGRDQFVVGAVGDNPVVARIDSHVKVGRGERLRLGLDPERIHLFDG